MNTGAPPAASRTALACVACRVSKIRCLRPEPPEKFDTACENCQSQGKECRFVPLPKTRRRKRTDVRVGELELQVRSLTAALHENQAQTVAGASPSEEGADNHGKGAYTKPSAATTDAESVSSSRSLTKDDTSPRVNKLQSVASSKIIPWAACLQLFRRYQTLLEPIYPILAVDQQSIAKDADVAVFRQAHPLLFLAMTTAAAATAPEHIRDALHETTIRTLAQKIMIDGDKTLELLQAVLITVAWYRPCASFSDTKFLQFTQTASLMAQEIGLDHGRFRERLILGDSTVEAAGLRILIASYCQTSSLDLLSSKQVPQFDPALIVTTLDAFQIESAASPLDRQLAAYAKCQLLVQEALRKVQASARLWTDIDIEEHRVQSTLLVYKNQLEYLLTANSNEAHDFLQIAVHSGIIQLYQLAFNREYDACDFRSPFFLDQDPKHTPSSIGPGYLTAMNQCQASSHVLLDIACGTALNTVSAMPAVVFVRMMHALFVLFRIHNAASSRFHPLSSLLQANQPLLNYYVAALRQLFSTSDPSQRFQGANKYLAFLHDMENRLLANAHAGTVDTFELDSLHVFNTQENRSAGEISGTINSPDWRYIDDSLMTLAS